jgi:hypothetical protein
MSPQPDTPLTQLLEQQRAEAALRRDTLGPIVEAVGMLHACCDTIRLLLDEMESSVGVHLELLDAVLRCQEGSRWWERRRCEIDALAEHRLFGEHEEVR